MKLALLEIIWRQSEIMWRLEIVSTRADIVVLFWLSFINFFKFVFCSTIYCTSIA